VNEGLCALALDAAAQGERFSLAAVRLPRNCVGRRRAALEAALRRAGGTPEEEWPPPLTRSRGERYPVGLLEKLRGECTRLAEELGLEASVIASRAALVAVSRRRPRDAEELAACGPLMRWQAELLDPRFRPLLGETEGRGSYSP